MDNHRVQVVKMVVFARHLFGGVLFLTQSDVLGINLNLFIKAQWILHFGAVVAEPLHVHDKDSWQLRYPESHLGDAQTHALLAEQFVLGIQGISLKELTNAIIQADRVSISYGGLHECSQ
jgi:hypothetical protein